MIEDRGGLGYRALEDAVQRLAEAATAGPGHLARVQQLQHAQPNVGCGRRPRQGRDAGRAGAHLCVCDAPDVPRRNTTSTTSTCSATRSKSSRRAMRPIVRTRSGSGLRRPARRRAAWCRSTPLRKLQPATAPYRVVRYNLYPAADLQGDTAQGYASGQAIAAMERLARETLPAGMHFEADGPRVPATNVGRCRRPRLRARRGVRVHLLGGALREPDAAVGRDPHRADAPARRDARRQPARVSTTTS